MRIFHVFFALLLVYFGVRGQGAHAESFVTPEQYGAYGDGIADDAPALNACIASGRAIRLTPDKSYALHSKLIRIQGNEFFLDGMGSRIIVARDYPVDEYDRLFSFSGDEVRRERFIVRNLKLDCYLDRKFSDPSRRGDSYMFYIGNCARAEVKSVDFIDYGKFNNVSFLVNTGAQLLFEDCRVVSCSHSAQGGGLWVMNQFVPSMSLKIRNVEFVHDSLDECCCIAIGDDCPFPSCSIHAELTHCHFSGNSKVPSSGFLIVYSTSPVTVPHFDVQIRSCTFSCTGGIQRRVLSYQYTGRQKASEARFDTVFEDCHFDLSPSFSKGFGLWGLLPEDCGALRKNVKMSFVRSAFRLKGIHSLSGDDDGATIGEYSYRSCRLETDGGLFVRRFNPGLGDIVFHCRKSDFSFCDSYVTTEGLEARDCRFYGAPGLSLVQVGQARRPLKLDVRNCRLNGKAIKPVSRDPFPLLLLHSRVADRAASPLLGSGAILSMAAGDELHIYVMKSKAESGQSVLVNGEELSMTWPEGSSGWFLPIPWDSPLLHKGKNRICSAGKEALLFIE